MQVNDVTESGEPLKRTYQNRILTCLAIPPEGCPLEHSQSIRQLLEAFRDVIRAPRSLDRKILHRDISSNIMILTEPKQAGGSSAMLIYLEYAVSAGEDGKNERTEKKTMTGTLQYIATEVLEGRLGKETQGVAHTYRHDLEPCLYVLLSVCIRYVWEKRKAPRKYVLNE